MKVKNGWDLFVLVFVGVFVYAAIAAHHCRAAGMPGECPSMSHTQAKAVVAPYAKKYGKANVIWDMFVTPRSKQAWLNITVLRPKVVQIRIPVTNTCPLTDAGYPGGVPQGWPVGVPYPQP